ncbi:PKD domain-containing protein [Labilibaculum antarcticum]|uniref:PKD domain-containing protein n=1 Tax=Labilibaculum antarcticum TaxID=1717717 RepID=A0A1Y1CQ58_9BACT|nr:PKD domain-containing protein [Labilibaculum antarcticum]BAX82599.1 hypothetical protein ALGA_4309 [Labilibaculum antarcticum]
MKKILYFILLLVVAVSCTPDEYSTPENLMAEDLSFTITPGDDAFTYVLTNTSNVTAIVKWDLGNGVKKEGDEVQVSYPLPGDYTIIMTVITKGGSTSISKVQVTTETNYAIFTDPKIINLTGGTEALNGKTWVLDSLANGHVGIGPTYANPYEWLSLGAVPNSKSASGMYDDKITFNINGFLFKYDNNGDSYVRTAYKDDANYSNQLLVDSDYKVDYPAPAPGTFMFDFSDEGDFLSIVSSDGKPLFPMWDCRAVDGKYEIVEITENSLTLYFKGGEGFAQALTFIPEGYVKPTVTFSASVEAGTGPNVYVASLADVVIPAGNSVSGYTVDFGDGSAVMEEGDYTASIEHTYMRKGAYNVTVVVMSSAGDFTTSQIVDVAEHHPDYVEFILDEMVMYNDFSEVELAPVLGENCALNIVDNPDAIYPNRSSKVAFYSKENNEWANANLKLSAGFRFDLRLQSVFKLKVYGKAGDVVLLKLENTDRGGNAWQTGVELTYTIQADNTWEVVEYDFAGVGAGFDWTGDIFTGDVTTDDNFNHDFYNIIRIMLNPGVGSGVHEFYFDELAGPHVEGVKSGRVN